MSDLITRLRTSCSPESPLGKLCAEAADALEKQDHRRAIREAKTLGEYLREARLNQKDFAVDIGVDPATICRLLKGKQSPGPGIVSRIELATHGEVNAHSWAHPTTSDTKLRRSKALDELGALDGELLDPVPEQRGGQ